MTLTAQKIERDADLAKKFYKTFCAASDEEVREMIMSLNYDDCQPILRNFSDKEIEDNFDRLVALGINGTSLKIGFAFRDISDNLAIKLLNLTQSDFNKFSGSFPLRQVESKLPIILGNDEYRDIIYTSLFLEENQSLFDLQKKLAVIFEKNYAQLYDLNSGIIDSLFEMHDLDYLEQKLPEWKAKFPEDKFINAQNHIEFLKYQEILATLTPEIMPEPCMETASLLAAHTISPDLTSDSIKRDYANILAQDKMINYGSEIMAAAALHVASGKSNLQIVMIKPEFASESEQVDKTNIVTVPTGLPAVIVHEMTHRLLKDLYQNGQPYHINDAQGRAKFELAAVQAFKNIAGSSLLNMSLDNNMQLQVISKHIVQELKPKLGNVTFNAKLYEDNSEKYILERFNYAASEEVEIMTVFTELHQLAVPKLWLDLLEPLALFWQEEITPRIEQLKSANYEYCQQTCNYEGDGGLICNAEYNPFKVCLTDQI